MRGNWGAVSSDQMAIVYKLCRVIARSTTGQIATSRGGVFGWPTFRGVFAPGLTVLDPDPTCLLYKHIPYLRCMPRARLHRFYARCCTTTVQSMHCQVLKEKPAQTGNDKNGSCRPPHKVMSFSKQALCINSADIHHMLFNVLSIILTQVPVSSTKTIPNLVLITDKKNYNALAIIPLYQNVVCNCYFKKVLLVHWVGKLYNIKTYKL